MGRNKNEYKLWKNSLNEKDDGYNIGTKKWSETKEHLISHDLPSAECLVFHIGSLRLICDGIFRRKIWKAIDSARLSQHPFSDQVPRGTNPAQQALTHLVDGSVIDIPLFPTPVTHNLFLFFSLNAVGHVWASASPRTDDDEGSRRFWRMRMTPLKIHL